MTKNYIGVTSDSRKVKAGFLFAALNGVKVKGADYIAAAIQKGATHILAEKSVTPIAGVTWIPSDNPHADFARRCAEFYARQPETVIAVTGTSGKTSTVDMLRQLSQILGTQSGSIGTLGVITPAGKFHDDTLTTPPPEDLFLHLKSMADAGVSFCAMEASSHAIDQDRIAGVHFAAAGFTNLSRDHLDYHQTMEDYFAAKRRLFSDYLTADKPIVVCTDDVWGQKLATEFPRALTVGTNGTFMHLVSQTAQADGQNLLVEYAGANYKIFLPLGGIFQAKNLLVACALLLATRPALGIDRLIDAVAKLQGIPGRLQRVDGHPKHAAIYVDYAHKPEGLSQVLDTLRPHTAKRLICVFGCGGDRDAGKRPLMGKIAADKADVVIVTDDNPRSENPALIRQAILAACPNGIDMGDRGKAIEHAVTLAETGDVVVIAGKGHEDYQLVGDKTLYFSDVEAVKQAITGMS